MKTLIETLKLPHGYAAEIYPDEDARNPFDEWDGLAPIAVWNLDNRPGHLDNYKGADLNLGVLLDALPPETWETRTGKRAILDVLGWGVSDCAAEIRWQGGFREAVDWWVNDNGPSGWRCAQEYFERMEAVAALAGIPHHYTQSNGCSQGDAALVFAAALPAWVSEVGVGGDLAAGCKADCELWGAWAWGDVFGAVIVDPKGEETGESCWGFYGSDHKASGLLEYAENAAECHRAARRAEILKSRAAAKAERRERFAAACRDIATA
jgi:hypothetical protein